MKYKTTNILMHGMSGKLRDLVFYQRGGKTCVRKAPGSYNKTPTEKQASGRELFKAAVQFAREILSNPVLKAVYQSRSKPPRDAYRTAISEYMAEHRLAGKISIRE